MSLFLYGDKSHVARARSLVKQEWIGAFDFQDVLVNSILSTVGIKCVLRRYMQDLFEQYNITVLPTFVALKGGDQVCTFLQLSWDTEHTLLIVTSHQLNTNTPHTAFWRSFSRPAWTSQLPLDSVASFRKKAFGTQLTVGQGVMDHGSDGSTNLDGSCGSWVNTYDPLTMIESIKFQEEFQ